MNFELVDFTTEVSNEIILPPNNNEIIPPGKEQ
ncbi:hypothetical protein ICY_04570 [Bacillus cereus BAG2X1-3]|nr:hypothetical protein ICU_04824 [Bacillus cereus BAG2X1-1]EJS69811.1 hypothetical protein ICY_04570 [Bacillus cereus BAG2X1-3]